MARQCREVSSEMSIAKSEGLVASIGEGGVVDDSDFVAGDGPAINDVRREMVARDGGFEASAKWLRRTASGRAGEWRDGKFDWGDCQVSVFGEGEVKVVAGRGGDDVVP